MSLLFLLLATNARFKKRKQKQLEEQARLSDLVCKISLPVMLLQCLKSTVQRDSHLQYHNPGG